MRTLFVSAGALLMLFGLGCDDDHGSSSEASGGQVMSSFQISDVNPTSTTSGQVLSPRDYVTFVSAWYFGHAT